MPSLNGWWKADGTLWQDDGRTTAVTTDNDPVGAADDASGNSRHALQSNANDKPLYKTGIQNSLPGILFDGSTDVLTTTGFTLDSFINASAAYGFAVLKATAISTNNATPETNVALF